MARTRRFLNRPSARNTPRHATPKVSVGVRLCKCVSGDVGRDHAPVFFTSAALVFCAIAVAAEHGDDG